MQSVLRKMALHRRIFPTCMKSTGAFVLDPWPPLCCSTPEAVKRNLATTSPVLPPSAMAHTLAVLSADTVTTCSGESEHFSASQRASQIQAKPLDAPSLRKVA